MLDLLLKSVGLVYFICICIVSKHTCLEKVLKPQALANIVLANTAV